jgi:hypothetical protein
VVEVAVLGAGDEGGHLVLVEDEGAGLAFGRRQLVVLEADQWRRPGFAATPARTPEVVVWSYEGCAEPTMRAVLRLIHPQDPEAPAAPYPVPRALQLPRHEQRPMRIRMPSANQARTRAARLTGLWRAQLDRSVYQLATTE